MSKIIHRWMALHSDYKAIALWAAVMFLLMLSGLQW